MKIKKSIEFEGNFISGEIKDEIAHLEIRSDDYTGKQIQELIVELQKVLQELPKDYLVREFIKENNSTWVNEGINPDVTISSVGSAIGVIHNGKPVDFSGWSNRGVKTDTEATFED